MYPLINRDNSCCFSGYRPEKLPWGSDENDYRCVALKETLKNAAERIVVSGIRHFICGMARGGDMYFCEAMLLLREKYIGITIEAAIPYQTQSRKWREEERDRYSRLVELCDYVTYVSQKYTRSCTLKRNRYMVNNASILLALYDGKPGGTKYTLEYAKSRELEVVEIAP